MTDSPKSRAPYVHGYHARENTRLRDQADALVDLLHADTFYPQGSRVLEAGCGVGAQTLALARNSPDAVITSIDISGASIAEARRHVEAAGIQNVRFREADLFDDVFEPESFDHVFVCFLLEHLPNPVEALQALKRLLQTGGSVTVIEGDHGSAYFHPRSEPADAAIRCQVELQKRAGGNAMIGRELYPLLNRAGFVSIRVSPRMVYADPGTPRLAEAFTRNTFTAMIEGVRDAALAAGMTEQADFDKGIESLRKAAGPDGVFCYTFFKAVAVKP